MAEEFLSLKPSDREDALGVAAERSGRPSYLLEKDVWVVWTLNALFLSPFGRHLVFKGGTSLSKAHKAIRRFSEDIDITYDIREIVPDLMTAGKDPWPPTRSQADKWSKAIKTRLPCWVEKSALPIIVDGLRPLPASASAIKDKIIIAYERLIDAPGYVSPEVVIEFGARATGEPCDEHPITCYAAEYLPSLVFPRATARVMAIARTFWEKATAAHVYCHQARLKGDRYSRHWHDLTRLDAGGHGDRALGDRELAREVAKHKGIFFAEKASNGQWVDYRAAVSGSLMLVPTGDALKALKNDYAAMGIARLLLDDDPCSFDELMERCTDLQTRANSVSS